MDGSEVSVDFLCGDEDSEADDFRCDLGDTSVLGASGKKTTECVPIVATLS